MTVYREAYSANFSAGLSFWAEWLTDAPSSELFEKALSSCPHFELANKYVEFASSLVEEEKLVRFLCSLAFNLHSQFNFALFFADAQRIQSHPRAPDYHVRFRRFYGLGDLEVLP